MPAKWRRHVQTRQYHGRADPETMSSSTFKQYLNHVAVKAKRNLSNVHKSESLRSSSDLLVKSYNFSLIKKEDRPRRNLNVQLATFKRERLKIDAE